MTIEQADSIDIVSVDRVTGDFTLVISDHLNWEDETTHLEMLQEKFNCYLEYIEGGQLIESHPESSGKKVAISVVGKHELTDLARDFFEQAKTVVENAGYGLSFRNLE